MNLHPSVLLLSKRLKVFLPLSGILALVTYILTLSHGVYPGFSSTLSAAAAGVIPLSGISHPLFALATRCIAALDLFSLPVRLNLFSALCGVFCAMLLYHLVARLILFCACEDSGGGEQNALSMLTDEDSPIEQEVAVYNKRVMRIAIAGGLLAAFLFIFSVPVWTAATRLNYGLFELLLLLASASLFPLDRASRSLLRLMLSIFLFVLGLFDSAVFLLLFPIYTLFVFNKWLLSLHRLLITCVITIAGITAVAFSLYAFRQNMNGLMPDNVMDFLISYARSLSVHHYHELRSLFPRSGWLLVVIQTGIPVMVLLFGRQILFKEKGYNTLIALILVTLVVLPGLLNLPVSPFLLFQPGSHLPVFSYAVIASATAAAFSACLIFVGPINTSQYEDDTAEIERLFFHQRGIAWTLVPALLFLAIATPLRSFNTVDTRRGAFADSVAREMLAMMNDRSWIISNGYLGNHLQIQALIDNKPLVLITLGTQTGPVEQSQIKKHITSSPVFEGLNRQRLLNAFAASPVRFVMEWFRMDPEAGSRAMVFATPDIWTACGYQAVPEGLAFGGIRSGQKLDLARIDQINRSFADRIVPLIDNPGGASRQLTALCGMLRMKTGFVFNELGVMHEDAEEYEAAYQAYQRASQIDPMNISAAMNSYTLVSTQKIHPEALDRLKKKVSEAMSNQNMPVQGLMGVLQNYGTVRQPAFYQQQAAMWSSIGSRTITSEKIRKAMALSGQTGAAELIQNAKVYVYAGDFNKAKDCYLAALEQDGANKAALSGLCTLMLTMRNTVEADKWIQNALASGMEQDALLYQNITLAILKGNTEKALKHLKEATKKYPADPRYWSLQADILLNQGNTLVVEQEILPKMQKGLKDTDHFLIHAVRGFLLRKKGPADYKEARLSLLKAVSINTAMPDVWNAIFELDIALGNLEFAETDAQNLLNADPDHAFANYLMGVSLLKRNKLPESEDYLRRSVEKSPTAAACNDLAENLRLQKKLGEAESFARRSLELDPQLLPALDTLACVLYDAGRFEESAQTASKAVAAKPQHLAYQLTLLRAQIQTGDNVGVQQRTDTLKALQYEIPEEMKKQINKMLYPLQSQLHRP